MACIYKGDGSSLVLKVQLGMLAEGSYHKRAESGMVACYNAVMASGKHRNWRAALRLLRDGLGEQLESDAVSYSASISASKKGSQWVQALAFLREMVDRRLESNVISYSASISASGRGS